MSYQILVGDNRQILPTLADNSINSIVTDPPYELGFMGKSWDSTGIAYDVDLWRECLRVLKPGGHLLAFGGSRTYHRLACAVEDAGFEIRDQIMWVYGSGFPKSLNIGKQDGCQDWEGWGTALKPAHEPIVVARKPLVGTVAANVLGWGVGGLNIDGCRVPTKETWQGRTLDGTPLTGYEGGDGLNAQTSPSHLLGRYPANLIHDGSDQVLELFPDSRGMKRGRLRRGASTGRSIGGEYTYGTSDPYEVEAGFDDSGSASRFFYCAKAGKKERNAGLDHLPAKFAPTMNNGIGGKEHDPQTATPKQNHHPTVKPIALMRYLVRLVTPPNGTVLDPFTGSGTTGIATTLENNQFIGIEMTPEYAEIAQARIQHWEQTK